MENIKDILGDDYIMFKGLDFYGSDILYREPSDINKLKEICDNDQKYMAFNSSGYFKNYVNINELCKYKYLKDTDFLCVHKDRYFNLLGSYKQFKNDISDLKKTINPDFLKDDNIPNIYHFIYLDGGQPFRINDYIGIKSAYLIQKPDIIYLYTDKEPVGNIWWERVKKYATIVIVTVPKIANNKIIPYFQHKADLMRLMILYEIGGVYMDLDIISLKSLNELRDKITVMGKETDDKLCNCVIMSRPKTKFIEKWITKYETIYGSTELCWWAGLSTIIPKQLRSNHIDEIHELKCEEIMPFMFNDFRIFYTNDYSDLYENSYTVHLWATESNKYGLLPNSLDYFNCANKFSYMFKKYIEEYL